MTEKQRYALRVRKGNAPIGEYVFNATPEGLRQLIASIKPEFQYDILGHAGIIHKSSTDETGA